jgi:preprotein translocase subunit SecG
MSNRTVELRFFSTQGTQAVAILTAILNTLIVIVSIFLICLILIQRGKGGGLAGAFGGVGGSSAFGTKAGDVFTRVTVVVAAVWIFLSLILVVLYNGNKNQAWGDEPTRSREVSPRSKAKTGSDKTTPAAPGSTSPSPTTPRPISLPDMPAGGGATPGKAK